MTALDADALTVLHAPGRRLAKLLHPDGRADGYDRTRTLDGYTVPVADLAGILALLQRLLPRPECCIVRGELLAGDRAAGIRRLLYPDKDTGEPPTVRDVPRRWLALDMEGVALPPDVPAADLAGCACLALATLPAAFHAAACIVQASASHGLRPDLRLRIWTWLDRPAWGRELKRWLRDTPADPSVFGAVQPIFTAGPLLAPGMSDPLPARLLFMPGRAAVAVPSPEALIPPPRPTTPPPEMRPMQADRYTRAALEAAAGRIATAAKRHPTIVREACNLARFVNAGLLAAGDMRAGLARAAEAAGKDDAAEVAACIDWGLSNPSSSPLPAVRA